MSTRLLTASGTALVAALQWAPLPASAAPLTQWGTAASTMTFECNDSVPATDTVVNCLSALLVADLSGVPLDPSFAPAFGGDDGGIMQALAMSSIDNATGKADADASLVPTDGISTPVLKAFAESKLDPQGSAVALAGAIEGYTNMSGSSQIYVLDVVLDATITDSTPGDGSTSVSAGALVLGIDGDLPDLGLSVDELIAVLLLPSVTLLDFAFLGIDSSVVTQVTDTLTFSLDDGQSAYFLSALEATAIRDLSVSDAFSTFTASFNNPVGRLVSASNSSVVTEPTSTALLLLAGLFGLSVRRRRSNV